MTARWMVDGIEMDTSPILASVQSYSGVERARLSAAIEGAERRSRREIAHSTICRGVGRTLFVNGYAISLLHGIHKTLVLAVSTTNLPDDFESPSVFMAIDPDTGDVSIHDVTRTAGPSARLPMGLDYVQTDENTFRIASDACFYAALDDAWFELTKGDTVATGQRIKTVIVDDNTGALVMGLRLQAMAGDWEAADWSRTQDDVHGVSLVQLTCDWDDVLADGGDTFIPTATVKAVTMDAIGGAFSAALVDRIWVHDVLVAGKLNGLHLAGLWPGKPPAPDQATADQILFQNARLMAHAWIENSAGVARRQGEVNYV
jgi:hypothetical protein